LRQIAAGGAPRAVDVVEARQPDREPEVLHEVAAHALAEELLPAVAVLGQRGIRVALLERGHPRLGLPSGRVDAGGRGEEEELRAEVSRGEQHLRVDEDGEHAERLVALDEAHPAHVGGEVHDRRGARGRLVAGGLLAQVEDAVVRVVEELVPLLERLHVDRAHVLVAAAEKLRDEVAADEPPATGDEYELAWIDLHEEPSSTTSREPDRREHKAAPGRLKARRPARAGSRRPAPTPRR
jgi:hypothetical protein